MSELIDREDPKVFAEKFAAAIASLASADTPEEFVRQFNYRPPPSDAERLEAARTAYAEHDKRWLELEFTSDRPAQQPSDPNERLRLFEQQQTLRDRKVEEEKALYKTHGERPTPLSVAEMVEAERARNWASPEGIAEMTNELERSNAQTLANMGYASTDDMHKGIEAPQPYLADRGVGEPRAYVLPNSDGRTIDEWIVVAGRPAYNPEFAKITDHIERLQKGKR